MKLWRYLWLVWKNSFGIGNGRSVIWWMRFFRSELRGESVISFDNDVE